MGSFQWIPSEGWLTAADFLRPTNPISRAAIQPGPEKGFPGNDRSD
jgi:hypothetical protein